MKNNGLIFNIILAIAVLGLYVLYFISPRSAANAPANNTPSQKASTPDGKMKFAFVNSDTLLLNYEFYKTAKKDLETKARLIQTDLRNRQTAFQNSVVSFQNTAGTMTVQKIEDTKRALAAEEQKIAEYGQSQEVEYAKEEQKLNEKLNENLTEFLKKYAAEKGYTYIFAYSRGALAAGLMYGNPDNDITKEVLTGMNEEYKKASKK